MIENCGYQGMKNEFQEIVKEIKQLKIKTSSAIHGALFQAFSHAKEYENEQQKRSKQLKLKHEQLTQVGSELEEEEKSNLENNTGLVIQRVSQNNEFDVPPRLQTTTDEPCATDALFVVSTDTCPACQRICSPEEIISGWSRNNLSYNTTCPQESCRKSFIAK